MGWSYAFISQIAAQDCAFKVEESDIAEIICQRGPDPLPNKWKSLPALARQSA